MQRLKFEVSRVEEKLSVHEETMSSLEKKLEGKLNIHKETKYELISCRE